jgi:hypothetical protein
MTQNIQTGDRVTLRSPAPGIPAGAVATVMAVMSAMILIDYGVPGFRAWALASQYRKVVR